MWVGWENTQIQILKQFLLTSHRIPTVEKWSNHRLSILDVKWLCSCAPVHGYLPSPDWSGAFACPSSLDTFEYTNALEFAFCF